MRNPALPIVMLMLAALVATSFTPSASACAVSRTSSQTNEYSVVVNAGPNQAKVGVLVTTHTYSGGGACALIAPWWGLLFTEVRPIVVLP